MAEARQRTGELGALNNIGANNSQIDDERLTRQSHTEQSIVPFIEQAKISSYDPSKKDEIAYRLAEIVGSGDRSSVQRARKILVSAEHIYDWGTLPLYFTRGAPIAAAFDIARGVANKEPWDVLLGTWGISRPLKSMPELLPPGMEKKLGQVFGSGAITQGLLDFFASLKGKSETKKRRVTPLQRLQNIDLSAL